MGIAVHTPGIGLSLSITLSVVVDSAIGVSVSTRVDSGVAVDAPGIGLGLSITLSVVVDSAIGVSVSTSVDTGIAVHIPSIRLGLSITLAIQVGSSVEDRVDSLGSKVGGSSNLLGWGIVRGHSAIRVGHETTLSIDSWGNNWGGHNGGNMVNTSGVQQWISLSLSSWLSLSLTLAIQVGSGVDWVDGLDNMSSVGQVLDGLLVGSQFRGSLLLGLGEVRGDCARSWVEFQTGVDCADNWGNTNNTTDSWVTSIEQSGVSGRGGAGASKSHNCDKSLHFGYCLVMLSS